MTRTLISTVVFMFLVGCTTEMVPATETAATVYHRGLTGTFYTSGNER